MDQNFYRKLFLVATILLFGVALLRILQPFGGALAWGACLALLLQPLHSWLSLRLRGRPDASAGIITALAGKSLPPANPFFRPGHDVALSYYYLFHGALLPGCVRHHSCERKDCVNPAHLESMNSDDHFKLHFVRARAAAESADTRRKAERGKRG